MKMSPSNTISSVISNGSSSPSGQLNPSTSCSSLASIWLRSLSRVIRKKWFLTLILSMSAIYCIISFTPSMNQRRGSIYSFYPKRYMGGRVHASEHFIMEDNTGDPDQQANSKLLFDHISSHELLAMPPESSKVNSFEELNVGQDLTAPTSTSSRINPIVFGSKIKLKSKSQSSHASDDTNPIKKCRNSVQGRLLLADDQGYVCHRQFLTKGGCCNSSVTSYLKSQSPPTPHLASSGQISRFSCNTCNSDGCCAIYEYCISCCMNPESINSRRQQAADHDQLLSSNLIQLSPGATAESDVLIESLDDAFEYCLAKCRTSSSSVKHENSYRDARFKHCHLP